MEIVRKGWVISAKDIDEAYVYEKIYVHATTRDKAKALGFKEMQYLNIYVESKEKEWNSSGTRDVEYTDVIARRCKEEDTYLYDCQEKTKKEIERLEWSKNRDSNAQKLSEEFPDKLAIVYNGSYGQYWGANRSGYSSSIVFAGKYSTEEAYDIVKGSCYSRQETVKLLDILQYNSDIDKEVEKLHKEIDRLISKKI
jgi:hypothetical protein